MHGNGKVTQDNSNQNKKMKTNKKIGIGVLALLIGMAAMADTDATSIVTAATAAFASVAALCVSIGTFFAVYKLVKKIK